MLFERMPMDLGEAIQLVEKYLAKRNDDTLYVHYEHIYRYKSKRDEVLGKLDEKIGSFCLKYFQRKPSLFNIKPLSYKVVEIPMSEEEVQDATLVVLEDLCIEYEEFYLIKYSTHAYTRTRDDTYSLVGEGLVLVVKATRKLYRKPSAYPFRPDDFVTYISGGENKCKFIEIAIEE